jgi:hypothetical protein
VKRLIWILVFVGAAWTVNEVRTNGYEGAFGGVLAGYLDPLESQGDIPLPNNALE